MSGIHTSRFNLILKTSTHFVQASSQLVYRVFHLIVTKVNGCNTETVHIWPIVGKAKMCLRGGRLFWKIVNKQLKNVNKCPKTQKNLPPLKHILALLTWGQICTDSVLQPFTFGNY